MKNFNILNYSYLMNKHKNLWKIYCEKYLYVKFFSYFAHVFEEKRQYFLLRRDARVAEEARLESVYAPKAYRGFESRFLRKKQA